MRVCEVTRVTPGSTWTAILSLCCLGSSTNYTQLCSPVACSKATLLSLVGSTFGWGTSLMALVSDFSVTPYGSTFIFPAPWGRKGLNVVAEILNPLLCSCRKSYPNAWGGPKGSSLCLEAQGDFHLLLYAEGCTERELRQLWGLPPLRG